MIVKMKKIAVIVTARDAEGALGKLRSLGVVHVEHQRAPQGKDISALSDWLTVINEAIGILSAKELSSADIKQEELSDWKFTTQHIIDLRKRIEQLEEYARLLVSRIAQWEKWGDFDPEKIKGLAEKNIFLKLYQIPEKEIEYLPKGLIIKKINISGGIANCVIISRSQIDIPYKEVSLPKTGLDNMRARLTEDLKTIAHLKEGLHKQVSYRESLVSMKNTLRNELEFYQALRGMGEAGALSYLAGYVPQDKISILRDLAKKESWGILISEPKEEDNVPTLIRSPAWVSLIQPIFKLLEIVPGYRELDISPLFLIFLSLFFGMIIGDAGYGAVYFILTAFFQKRMPKAPKRVFFLFYLFSSCAILWGLLTGTLFGQEWYIKAGMKPFIPILNDTKFLQSFCFFLGALHLSLAHGWRTILKLPSAAALADIGWIILLWTGFFLAKTLILDAAFPDFGRWMIIAGVSLTILFSNPQKNILKAIASGLASVALSLMNSFTDVVSYIRLFAVGLAGVAIADTVNALAGVLGGENLFAKALIIFIGHTINIILGPMSVLVHGIRLNVLEFSGHANVSWSGVVYKPLKE